MKLKRYGLALAVGLIGISTAYAAGLWPDFPVVGGASYCAGTSNSATGTIIGAITGCPNTVPAGPSIVTGNEQIPADTRLSSGANPQTVLIPMASLNALPITISMVTGNSTSNVSATNTQGGILITSPTANISRLNVSLPPTPIDGQQFAVSANQNIMVTSFAATTPASQTLANGPAQLTIGSATAPQTGYRWVWSAAQSTWFRLQ